MNGTATGGRNLTFVDTVSYLSRKAANIYLHAHTQPKKCSKRSTLKGSLYVCIGAVIMQVYRFGPEYCRSNFYQSMSYRSFVHWRQGSLTNNVVASRDELIDQIS